MNVQTDTSHPSWCSADECLSKETHAPVHRSRPVPATSARTGLTTTVHLVQFTRLAGYPDSGQPFISLELRFPDDGPDHPAEEYHFCLDRELAATLGDMLAGTARTAQ